MDRLGISVGPGNWEYLPAYTKAGIRDAEISLPALGIGELRLFACRAYALAAESGMDLWSVHLPFSRELDISSPDEGARSRAVSVLKERIDLARGLGAGILVVHGSSEPNEDASRPARMEKCGQSLRELASYAAGMRLAVENLPRTCIGRTGKETAALAKNCGGICFDVNHLLLEDHDSFMDEALDRIVTVHLSDYDGKDERHRLPGTGIVPWKRIRERLLGAGYRGPFLFELRNGDDGKPYPPEEVVSAWRRAAGD